MRKGVNKDGLSAKANERITGKMAVRIAADILICERTKGRINKNRKWKYKKTPNKQQIDR